jgi:hypothetical protein
MEEATKRIVIDMISTWLQHGKAIENVLQNNGLSDIEIDEIIREVVKQFDQGVDL